MSENNATMNLNRKLFELRKYVDVVKKSKKGYGYTYASIVEILAKLKAGMDKYGLLLEEECVHGSQKIVIDHYEKQKATKNGDVIQEVVHEFVVSQDIILPGSMWTVGSRGGFPGHAAESRQIRPRRRAAVLPMLSVNS